MEYVVLPDGSVQTLSAFRAEHPVKHSLPVQSHGAKLNSSSHRRKNKKIDRSMLTPYSGAPVKPVEGITGTNVHLVYCPLCSSKVRSDRIESHCARVHGVALNALEKHSPERTENAVMTGGSIHSFEPLVENSDRASIMSSGSGHHFIDTRIGASRPVISPLPSSSSQISASRDVATSHESDFGMRGMGHMAREDSGRFGSLPLFDDYGSGEEQ